MNREQQKRIKQTQADIDEIHRDAEIGRSQCSLAKPLADLWVQIKQDKRPLFAHSDILAFQQTIEYWIQYDWGPEAEARYFEKPYAVVATHPDGRKLVLARSD